MRGKEKTYKRKKRRRTHQREWYQIMNERRRDLSMIITYLLRLYVVFLQSPLRLKKKKRLERKVKMKSQWFEMQGGSDRSVSPSASPHPSHYNSPLIYHISLLELTLYHYIMSPILIIIIAIIVMIWKLVKICTEGKCRGGDGGGLLHDLGWGRRERIRQKGRYDRYYLTQQYDLSLQRVLILKTPNLYL